MDCFSDSLLGAINFMWDGRTAAYWKVYQADAYGDYKKVAETSFLKKGSTQLIELAPGKYWAQREENNAQRNQVAIEAGSEISISN